MTPPPSSIRTRRKGRGETEPPTTPSSRTPHHPRPSRNTVISTRRTSGRHQPEIKEEETSSNSLEEESEAEVDTGMESRVSKLERLLEELQKKHDEKDDTIKKLKTENHQLKKSLKTKGGGKRGGGSKESPDADPEPEEEKEALEGIEIKPEIRRRGRRRLRKSPSPFLCQKTSDDDEVVVKEEVETEQSEYEFDTGGVWDGGDLDFVFQGERSGGSEYGDRQGDRNEPSDDSLDEDEEGVGDMGHGDESDIDDDVVDTRKRKPIKGKGKRKIKRTRNNSFIAPKTEIEIAIASFFDGILDRPSDTGKVQEVQDKNDFDPKEVGEFQLVFKKRIESLISSVTSSEENRAIKRKNHKLEYFAERPSVPHSEIVLPTPPQPRSYVEDLDCAESSTKSKRKHNAKDTHPGNNETDETEPVQEPRQKPQKERPKNPRDTCTICNKMFHSPAHLRIHMARHSAPTVPCPQCGKLFKATHDLSKHIQYVHERIFKYQCSMCPMKFIDASGCRRHEKKHLDIKDHLCGICGCRFVESSNLRSHMKRQHGIILEVEKRVKRVDSAIILDQ